jgi:hypothetical protein
MFVAFYWLIAYVCFVLGSTVLEPFFEDFQDQAFEESQFFFVEQQGKCLDHFAPITFPIYSVEIKLYDRSKRYPNLCYAY